MTTQKTTKRKNTKNKKQAKTRKTLMNLGLILGLGVLLMIAWADMLPKTAPLAPSDTNTTSTAQPKSGDENPSQVSPADTSSSRTAPQPRRPAAFYDQGISGGMFSEPQPPAPKIVSSPPPTPKVEMPPDSEPSIVPETPVNPFTDWSYNGLVTMGDQMMALLENSKTKEGQYVQTGDSFLSAKVENITDQMVSLREDGKLYTIPKSETITVVPLDKSAPYLNENSSQTPPNNPQEAQAQTPQAPSSMNGMPNSLANQFNTWQQMRSQFRGMGRGRRMGRGLNFQQMNPPGP